MKEWIGYYEDVLSNELSENISLKVSLLYSSLFLPNVRILPTFRLGFDLG